jgi:hypothetical protein
MCETKFDPIEIFKMYLMMKWNMRSSQKRWDVIYLPHFLTKK